MENSNFSLAWCVGQCVHVNTNKSSSSVHECWHFVSMYFACLYKFVKWVSWNWPTQSDAINIFWYLNSDRSPLRNYMSIRYMKALPWFICVDLHWNWITSWKHTLNDVQTSNGASNNVLQMENSFLVSWLSI